MSGYNGFVNAADFGFSPNADGIENMRALQKAIDIGGTIQVTVPGTYKLAGTVYIGSYTTLTFGNNVFVKKVDEQGTFSHVILNKGALNKVYDEHISVENLHIIVNNIDVRKYDVFGLHGQLAFFYIKDLKIQGFRCMDLGKLQYGIHICTFEDVIVNDVIIKGDKDGVHFGPGKRFLISNGVFQCFDDAIALNAYDYDVGNPEAGWIEDGIVENCHDLDAESTTGFFCRIVAGGWRDWEKGMKVQKSDTVVSNGRIYRVKADPDGNLYISNTQPTHENGMMVLDGITWVMSQETVTYTAGVRNVIFRNIFLRKPRTSFSIYFHNDRYFRAYYPGSLVPVQEQLSFDNIRVLYDDKINFLENESPMDVLTITNSSFKNNSLRFWGNIGLEDYGKTKVNLIGCVFNHEGPMELLVNDIKAKKIVLKTSASIEIFDDFTANVVPGPGEITVQSDLTGLKYIV